MRSNELQDAEAAWMTGLRVPASWTRSRVKHLVRSMRAGDAITVDAIEDTGDYPVYGANGLRGFTSRRTHRGTHVLIGRQGALCGNVHLVSGEFWASEHAIVATPSGDIDERWLAALLRVMNLGQYSTSAAQPGIGVGQIAPLHVYVPPTDEQRAIADFLDRETAQIDALVAKQEDLLTLLAERKQSVLDCVLASVVGETRRLRWLYRPSSEANKPDEEVLSVYREHGVIPKSSRTDNFNKTPENVERYLLVRPDDLVVNKMKAWQGSLGISAHRGIVSGDYEVLRPTTPTLDPEYAHYRLRSPELVLEYRLRSRGIRPSQWRLYWQDLADIELIVPPLAEQRIAAARIKSETTQIDVLIAKAEEHIALAKERRSALITAAVTGQIDVRTARKAS